MTKAKGAAIPARPRHERINDRLPGEAGRIFWRLDREMSRIVIEHETMVELYGTGTERLELLQQTAPAFFADLRVILADHLLLRVIRLFDSPGSGKRRNLSFPALIKELWVRPNRRLLERLERKLIKAQAVTLRLRVARDKRIAHNDRGQLDGGNEFGRSNVTRSELEKLLKLCVQFMNAVESHYAGSKTEYLSIERSGGVKALLRSLERGRSRRPLVRPR